MVAQSFLSGVAIATALWTYGTSAAAADALARPGKAKYLTRDVVVLGGGGSGAHAAVRLRRDFNKTVTLVEKNAQLVSAESLVHT